jgi:hypothetical protein
LEGEANEDSTFDQSTKDKNDCSIEVAEGEQCSKRRKKIEGEAEDVKYRDEKGCEFLLLISIWAQYNEEFILFL